VTLAEDSAIRADKADSKHAAIFTFQVQRDVYPFAWINILIEFYEAFNSMKAGDWKARAFRHSLKPADLISNFAHRCAVQNQFSAAGDFFNALHHGKL
jgi:hypothetical protein